MKCEGRVVQVEGWFFECYDFQRNRGPSWVAFRDRNPRPPLPVL